MKINEKIYSLRKQHNLSQEELADKLNVSRQTVSKWELGESNPDSDKIVPLCDLFGITTEELLRDRKIEKIEETEESEERSPDVIKALLICTSILLYFVSLIVVIVGEEMLNFDDGLIAASFCSIAGVATVILVFTHMTRPGKRRKEIQKEEYNVRKDPVLEALKSIFALIATFIYLGISFMTGFWHITWLIWIIYAIITKILDLIFVLKAGKKNEE